MWASLWRTTSISALKISKNALAQNAMFVINSWKVKELVLVAMHTMRGALFVPLVGEACFFFNYYYILVKFIIVEC